MDGLLGALAGLLQIVVVALIAPLVTGALRLLEARIQLRAGPPVFQPYAELWKLLIYRRGIPANTTSWVFVAAPYIAFGCYALLAWAAPPIYPAFAPLDFLAVVYLLALARFVMALAGLDTGTPFGGMGSSREMFLNMLVEPALVVIAFALALHLHGTNMMAILAKGGTAWLSSVYSGIALGCMWLALAVVALMETGRLPVDNPASNMELGMFQKALHLDYAGSGLALLEWGEAMRLTFFVLLLGNLIVPPVYNNGQAGTILVAMGLVLVKLSVGVIALGVFELFQVKLRLRRVAMPGAFALVLGLVAISMTSIAAIVAA